MSLSFYRSIRARGGRWSGIVLLGLFRLREIKPRLEVCVHTQTHTQSVYSVTALTTLYMDGTCFLSVIQKMHSNMHEQKCATCFSHRYVGA